MAVRIEEVFQVAAPADQVWSYLIDPEQVVDCLPGANLTEVQDERTYTGTVKIKVGPVTASYRGKVQITEQDDENHTVKMLGEGMESSGAGSAKMELTSQVLALDGGGTEVRVVQDVEVVGKLAQFGRGMVQEVGKQLFRQFVTCAKARLEADAAAGGVEASASTGQTPGAAPPAATASQTGTTAPAPQARSQSAESPATSPRAATSSATGPEKKDEAIGGISLFFKALWSLITRPFRKN